jgi:putative membrane protein
MKKIFVLGFLMSLTIFGLSGCGGAADNRSSNYNTSNMNSPAMNTNGMSNNGALMPNQNTGGNANTGTAMTDNEFMTEAAVGGMAEVELGKLASTKAQNADVKKFGQMMVADHSKANTELKALATKKGVTLPTDLDAKHKATMTELQGLSGAAFDKAYVADMLADHEKDVKMFQAQAQNATDPDVKAFAAKTLPTLQAHLEAVRNLHNKMNTITANTNAMSNSGKTNANGNMKNTK